MSRFAAALDRPLDSPDVDDAYERFAAALAAIVTGLGELGYRFDSATPVQPVVDLAPLTPFTDLGLVVPPPLLELWRRIGSIDLEGRFAGDRPPIKLAAGVPNRDVIYADPLVIHGPAEATDEVVHCHHSITQAPPTESWIELAHDDCVKAGFGGGDPDELLVVPVDGVYVVTAARLPGGRTTFGAYLERYLLGAGLPDLPETAGPPGFIALRSTVAALLDLAD